MNATLDLSALDLSAISASDVTNIATILMCVAVLVQSVRMMRSLKAMRESALAEAAQALDRATAAANHVLGELKRTLKEDSRATADALREGAALREELIVMVGIANSVAERLVEVNGTASATIASATALTTAGAAPEAEEAATPAPEQADEDILELDDPEPDQRPFSLKMAVKPFPSMPRTAGTTESPVAPRASRQAPTPAPAPALAPAPAAADAGADDRTVALTSIMDFFR